MTPPEVERLARRMAETAGRSMVNLGPYKTCDDAAEQALLPFASLLVQMAGALKMYVECGQFKLILQHGRGTAAAVNAERAARASLAAYDALIAGEPEEGSK